MNYAVVLAAGSSHRFIQSGGQDKLFHLMPDGRPMWRWSVDTLASHPDIEGVGVVCPFGREDLFRAENVAFTTHGGPSRRESALNGVKATPPSATIVLVHDAARPFLSPDLVTRVIRSAEEFGAAIPCIPIHDTVKKGPDFVKGTLDRESLFRAQTPQAAKRSSLLTALAQTPVATDEAQALEAAGFRVKMVQGDEANVKVTTLGDLPTANEIHTGFGYDIHSFSKDPSRPLRLGGVYFPGEPGLAGHSDADVVLHAVTDALLGAVGLPDIGVLFPNTSPEWANADSRHFLRVAAEHVLAEGYHVCNVDITVLAERPRISERREEICRNISQDLGIPERRISIKATTSEGIGALGRGEGIAAMAVATVARIR